MKKLSLIVFFTITQLIPSFSQNLVKTPNRNDLVGQKIKFIKIKDNVGYMYVSKFKNGFPWIKSKDYENRYATILSKNNDLYTLVMDDSQTDTVYFVFKDDDKYFPEYIGICSILDSAREKYINKTCYSGALKEYKVLSVDFSDNKPAYSYTYIIKLLGDNDTTICQRPITDLYGFSPFESLYSFKNPFEPLTKNNVYDIFSVEEDKMDNKTIYVHKMSLPYDITGLYSKIVYSNNIPKLKLVSNYYESDWLFHSYVKIKIGDVTKQTSVVEGLTEVMSKGYVMETNTYSSITDVEIVKWIAQNYTNEITIRMYGKQYYKDKTLSLKEKWSIKQTYDLYIQLKTK